MPSIVSLFLVGIYSRSVFKFGNKFDDYNGRRMPGGRHDIYRVPTMRRQWPWNFTFTNSFNLMLVCNKSMSMAQPSRNKAN